tara:strand:+ start:155 stop:361 length:207 start_codon:yes stop_codon:yes gene_type:complete
MAATSGMGGGMQGRFLGNSGELNPEIWDAANVRFCLVEKPGLVANGRYNGTFDKDYSLELYHFGFSSL